MNTPELNGSRLYDPEGRRNNITVFVPMGREIYLVDGPISADMPESAIYSETLSERLHRQTLEEVHSLAVNKLGSQAIGTVAEISPEVQQELR